MPPPRPLSRALPGLGLTALGRLSLTRLVGIMGLFALVFILAATVTLAWVERNRLLRNAATQADSAAFTLADHADRLFEVADVALGALSATLGDRDWDVVEKDAALQEQMKSISQALPYIEDVWFNDAEGRLRLTSLAFPAPESNAADRVAFRLIQTPGSDLAVGDLIVGKVTKRETFLVARRLNQPDSSLRGMVSVTADLTYFSDYWQRLRLTYPARISLLRSGSRDVLARYPAVPEAEDPGAAAPIVASSPVGELPLLIHVEFPRSAVLDAWGRWLGTYLPPAFASFLAMGVLSLVAFRQGRREAAANAEVRQARAQLAAANAGLEATVAQRTAELREANEEVQRFAYLVSHDLRAPLVNVLGFTVEVEALGRELLESRAAPPSDARWSELGRDLAESIGFIRAGTTKIDGLLTHILKLAREGRRVLRPETLDMERFVRELAGAVRYQAQAAGAEIEVRSLPPIVADRLAIEQVFGNLLDNAVKYLSPARPGRIVVSGHRRDDRVRYEVADNGRGIAPQDHARVFELFRRAGALDQPGDGIGLAHVRAVVRALGGRIDLSSELDVGTTFVIDLPQHPTAEIRVDTATGMSA